MLRGYICIWKKRGEPLSGVTSWAGFVSFPDFRSAQRVWLKEERGEKEEEDEKEEGGKRVGRRREGEEKKRGEERKEKGEEEEHQISRECLPPRWPVLHVGPLQTPPQLFRQIGLGQRFL